MLKFGSSLLPLSSLIAAPLPSLTAVGQKPYTWFRLGQVVLEGGCYALALAFLTKAVALLPPGLQQQEKVGWLVGVYFAYDITACSLDGFMGVLPTARARSCILRRILGITGKRLYVVYIKPAAMLSEVFQRKCNGVNTWQPTHTEGRSKHRIVRYYLYSRHDEPASHQPPFLGAFASIPWS